MKEYVSEENQSVNAKKGMNPRDKKLLAFVIVGAVLCVVLGFVLVRMCTNNPYDSVDYSSLVKFADTSKIEVRQPEDLITDAAVDEEIEQRLLAAGKNVDAKKGKVQYDSVVGVDFSATKEDGSVVTVKDDVIRLSQQSYGEDFSDNLAGRSVGDSFAFVCTFPSDCVNRKLAGETANVIGNIRSIKKLTPAKLDEEFIKEDTNGDFSSEKQYRKFIREELCKSYYTELYDSCSQTVWEDFMMNSEIEKPTKTMIDHEYNLLLRSYKHRYNFVQSGNQEKLSWEDWLSREFGFTEEEYEEVLHGIAETNAQTKMFTYAYWDKNKNNGLTWSNKIYEQFCEDMLSDAGLTKDTIEGATGYTWTGYCDAMDMHSVVMTRLAARHLYGSLVENSSK